jgi:hypothetical protein
MRRRNMRSRLNNRRAANARSHRAPQRCFGALKCEACEAEALQIAENLISHARKTIKRKVAAKKKAAAKKKGPVKRKAAKKKKSGP